MKHKTTQSNQIITDETPDSLTVADYVKLTIIFGAVGVVFLTLFLFSAVMLSMFASTL